MTMTITAMAIPSEQCSSPFLSLECQPSIKPCLAPATRFEKNPQCPRTVSPPVGASIGRNVPPDGDGTSRQPPRR
eukprot:12899379-Prorocentrum_lima.AAC.1